MSNDFCFVDNPSGEDYEYAKKIKTPTEMGVSPDGGALSKNIDTMGEYSNVLVSGKSQAHRGPLEGKPLGNRYFIKTTETCKYLDSNSNEVIDVSRNLYIDTIPDNIHIGFDLPDTRGLVPGLLGDIQNIIPKDLLSMTSDNSCVKLNLHVRRNDNTNSDTQTEKCEAYVTEDDAQLINPCAFPLVGSEYKNTVSKETTPKDLCPEREGFITANNNLYNNRTLTNVKHINSNIENLYILGVGGLFVYLLYKVCNKY